MYENLNEHWSQIELPSIPSGFETGWRAPRDFPNLSGVKLLGIDTETYDPHLKTHGPGWARNAGKVVGVSLATLDKAWYFPFAHDYAQDQNLDREAVLGRLRELGKQRRDYVGANLQYDVGWLRQEGVELNARYLFDVQNAEPLLDEFGRYSLETLAQKYLDEGKTGGQMYAWAAQKYGGKPTARAQAGRIHQCPPELVGPYAEADAQLPLRILAEQRKALAHEDLNDLFMLETRLLPLLVDMRWRGVRVDVPRAEALNAEWAEREQAAQVKLNDIAAAQVDVWAAGSIANAFQRLNIAHPMTPAGAPSFTADFLETCDAEIAGLILTVRKLSKARGTFVESYVLDKHVDGVLHGQFHQLRRSDDAGDMGAVSGRFSSSDPNLQNLPSRDDEIGPAVRGLFAPFAGDKQWRRYDYSQIEYRLLAHYAVGQGANEARRKFREDPTTDYHDMVQELIKEETGIALDRKPTKNINFGLAYGMGQLLLRRTLGLDKAQAKELFDAYHQGVPFVQATFRKVMNRAMGRGWIKTLLGRRARFDLWEPIDWALRQYLKPSFDRESLAAAVEAQIKIERANCNELPKRGVQRAYGHKALNRLLQGGAADVMKKAMVDLYEGGIFDETGLPLVTVHDELGFSDPGTSESEAAFAEAKHIMESCVELRVPLRVDCETGPSWGECS